MIGTPRHDVSAVQRTVPDGKFTWLGKPIGGYQYGIHAGQEFAVDLQPAPDPSAFVAQPGEILVSRSTKSIIDGTPWETTAHFRAWPVAPGTHADLVAKARKPAAEKPMRAWDALSSLPVMQRREPLRLPTTPASNNVTVGLFKALHGKQASVPYIEVHGNEPPERSPAGIIAHLERRGVELTLARGRLVARSRTPMRADDKALIEQAEELIVGLLRGQPLICSTCAAPAVSLAFPRAPMCAAHLEAGQ